MSIVLASNTGFPWSFDSASANSSNWASMRSAIFLIIPALYSGVVTDQLQRRVEVKQTKEFRGQLILQPSLAILKKKILA